MSRPQQLVVDFELDANTFSAVPSTDYLRQTMLPPLSPVKSLEQMPSPMTRYGKKADGTARFGTEKRFRVASAQLSSDVMYNLPSTLANQNTVFGTSSRGDFAPKSSNSSGPATYDVSKSDLASSKSRTKHGMFQNSGYSSARLTFIHQLVTLIPAITFGVCTRQGLNLNTLSPGAVYNVEGVFKTGKDARVPISFNRDLRKPIFDPSAAINAEMYYPQLAAGKSVSFGFRHDPGKTAPRSPGAIYNVHETCDFRTGPAHTFGSSKTTRFGPVTS